MAASEIDQHAAAKVGFMTSFNNFQEGWVSTLNCMNGKMLNFIFYVDQRESPSVRTEYRTHR